MGHPELPTNRGIDEKSLAMTIKNLRTSENWEAYQKKFFFLSIRPVFRHKCENKESFLIK